MAYATQASTPSDLDIVPRDRRFSGEAGRPRHWHGGRVEATAIFNALSATFPKGEAFFVESVRAFRHNVPTQLARDIAAFTTQEAIHSREHVAFNRLASDAGYDLSSLESKVDQRLGLTRGKPPIVHLAATMALEHYTAMFAHQLLADPRHLAGAEHQCAELWRWHAVEEVEHKGVAYDTWLHATREWPRFRRWRVKTMIMLILTSHFVRDRTAGALELMRQDGLSGVKAWSKLLWYVWVRPGMFRKVAGAWAAFFLPRFHPWNHDDRALLATYDVGGTAPAKERRVRGTRPA